MKAATITAIILSLCVLPAPAQDEPRELFLPTDQLDAVFEQFPKGVMLSRERYEELRNKADAAAQNQNIPTPITLSFVSYRVRQAGEQAVIDAQLRFRQFADDMSSWRIPLGNLSPESATIDGRAAPVAFDKQSNSLVLFHHRAESFVLHLTLSAPLGSAGSDRLAAFRLLPGVSSEVTVECPAERYLEVNNLKLNRTAPSDQPASYRIPAGDDAELRLRWTTEQQESDMQTLIFVRSQSVARLSRDNLRWSSSSRVSVFGNAINQVVIRVPSTLEVTSVESTGLESWKLEDTPNNKSLTRVILNYRQPFSNDRMVELSAVAPVSTGEQQDVPALEFVDVTAHTGRIVVTHEDQLRLVSRSGEGIRHLGTSTGSGSLAAGEVFDHWLQLYRLQVSVRQRERELFAEINSALSITDSEGILTAELTAEPLNAPLFELPLQLPKSWEPQSILDEKLVPVQWRKGTTEDVIIIQPAAPVAAGGLLTVNVTLKQSIDNPDEPQTILIPAIRPLDGVTVGGTYEIEVTRDLIVEPENLQGLSPIGDKDGVLLFEIQGASVTGQLTVRRRPVRLASRTVVRSSLNSRSRSTELVVTVDITNGTTRTLELSLPEDVGSDVRFHVRSIGQVPGYESQIVPGSVRIAEQSAGDVVDGRRQFLLTLDGRIEGALTLSAVINQESEETEMQAPSLTVAGATRQHGLVVFDAYPEQQLSPSAMQGLTQADAGLVPPADARRGLRTALVYRFTRPGYSLNVKAAEFGTESVPSAVCEAIDNVTVVTDTGSIQRSCDMSIRCSGVQTLRFALPEKTTLWSTMLNGEPVEVRRDGNDYLVAVPSEELQLKILFATEGRSTIEGTLTQEPVRLRISNSKGKQSRIEILQQTWLIRFPDSAVIVDHQGGFEDLSKCSQTGWLQSLISQASIPSPKTAWERSIGVAIVLAVLALVTTLIVRKRWKTLGVLGTTAVIVVMANSIRNTADNMTMVQTTREAALMEDGYDAGGYDKSVKESAAAIGNDDGKMEGNTGGMPAPAEGLPMQGLDDMFDAEAEEATKSDEVALSEDEQTGAAPGDSPFAPPGTESSTPLSSIRSARTDLARLSVIARIVNPDSYTNRQYRSIGAADEAATLAITFRRYTSLNAYRFIAAAMILLIGLWTRKKSLSARIATISIPAVLALGTVPLLPAEYQPIADGIVLGCALTIALWLSLQCCCCVCRAVCHCCSSVGAGKAASAAGLILMLFNNTETIGQQQKKQTSEPDVIVPYNPDRPALLSDRIYLPQARFMELYRSANPDEFPDRTAVQSGVVAAWYTSEELRQVKTTTWSQQFTARYVIITTGSGARSVPLPIGTVAISSAVLDGHQSVVTAAKPVPQQARQQQSQVPARQKKAASEPPAPQAVFFVRIPEASTNDGMHILDLKFEAPATQDKQVGHVSLPLHSVPVGALKYTLAGPDLTTRVNGRTNTFRRDGDALTIPIAAGGPLRIDWRPDSETGQTETTLHSSVNSALQVNDQGLALNADVSITVRQGAVSELQVGLPAGYALQQVKGPDIAGWNVIDGDDPQLKLVFRAPVENQSAISLTLFRREVFGNEPATVAVPIPAVQGASRDSGYATVVAGTELDIRANTLSGVTQINPAESQLPATIDNSSRRVLAWRYTRHPAKVAVRIQRTDDELKARVLNGIQLESTRQLWTTQLTADISGSPRRRLEVVLPTDLVILDVAAQNLADWYLTAAPNGQTGILNIHLTKATRGKVSAVIQSQRSAAVEGEATRLSAPVLIGADKQETHLSIWLDQATEFASSQAEGWKRASANRPVPTELRKLKTAAPSLSLVNDQIEPAPVLLSLRQRQVTVTPESVTVTNVTDTSRELTLGLNWRIDNAAKEFSFSLPETLQGVFDFRIPGLRQLEESEPVNGRITYTVHLQQPISEKFFVIGIGSLPLPEDSRVTVEPPEFAAASSQMTVASQSHFWVLVNQSSGLLSPENADEDTGRDVLPADIEIPDGFMNQAVAVRRLASGAIPGWNLNFPEQQAVSPAVVALAAHTTVIAEDGTWRSLHKLQVRNEARQFLPVILPEKSRVLYCRVQENPTRIVSRLEGDQTVHLIPIPQSGQLAAPFSVEFAIAGVLTSNKTNINARPVSLPVPIFPEYRDHPSFGITVSRNTWRVYVPRKWQAAINSDPRKTNVEAASEDALEDTRLLSVVDDARSIISYANSKATKDNVSLYQEIENRQYVLEQVMGNTDEAEQQRADAIEQLEVLKQQIDVPESISISGNNQFLDNIDLNTNDFNNSNTVDLLRRNINPQQTDNTIQNNPFNFTLPEMNKEADRQIDEFEKDAEASKGGKEKSQPTKPGLIDNRSKLLKRRDSNVRKKSEELRNLEGRQTEKFLNDKGPFSGGAQAVPGGGDGVGNSLPGNFSGNFGGGGFGGGQAANGQRLGSENQAGLVDGVLNQNADRAGGAVQGRPNRSNAPALTPRLQSAPEEPGRRISGEGQDGQNASSGGVLSLRFEIPEDGVHYDFVRTGGNARLTLDVRSRESLHNSFGLLWAAACLVAIIVLVNAESWRHLARRLCGVLVFGGLAGWLLFPMTTAVPALIVILLAALTYAVVTIYSVYRPIPVES